MGNENIQEHVQVTFFFLSLFVLVQKKKAHYPHQSKAELWYMAVTHQCEPWAQEGILFGNL